MADKKPEDTSEVLTVAHVSQSKDYDPLYGQFTYVTSEDLNPETDKPKAKSHSKEGN